MDTTANAGHPSAAAMFGRLQGVFLVLGILLAAFLFAETLKSLKEYRYVGGGVPPTNVISVNGEGEVFAIPDSAEFTFSVEESGDTVAAVQEAAKGKVDAALAALKSKGVEEKDVKTAAYELHPKYEWIPAQCVRFPCDRRQVQRGFTLTQTVAVTVRDANRSGELLQAVTDAGAQNVSGLTFKLAEPEVKQAEARALAIEDAKEKADELAKELGVSLVRIVNFGESNAVPPMPYNMKLESAFGGAMDQAASAPQVPAGENRILSNVTISYEIR